MLEFIIRLEPHGKMSEHIAHLNVGDTLNIKGPFGRFGECHIASPTELIFIAGGVGIAPIRSMIQYHVGKRTEEQENHPALSLEPSTFPHTGSQTHIPKLSLYYAFRNPTEYLFREELESLANSGQLTQLITSSSEQDPDWSGNTGYITDHLRPHLTHTPTQAVFLCGPPPMVDSVRKLLSEMGYDRRQIHLEAW